MTRLTRDLSLTGGMGLVILASLLLFRLTAVDPAPIPSTGDDTPATAAIELLNPDPGRPPATSTPLSTAPPTPTSTAAGSRSQAGHPNATLVLSSGIPVIPHPQQAPRTYRPAPTSMPTTIPTPPADPPGPGVFDDPTRLGAAWLSAMCWYDFRTGDPQANIRRAGVFGDTSMPHGKDPWTLDDQAWTRVTTGHLGSGCTDITTTVAQTHHDTTGQLTVTLTATQILTVDGTPYQASPITHTRSLRTGSDGWLIGPPVTAN